MATTVYKFPCFLSLSHHKPFSKREFSLTWRDYGYQCPERVYFRKIACSAKKSRGSRKAMSNVELCNEIREFLSAVGLPESHVPTTKELSEHGRNDLANIVRRRGYKLIRGLLSNSTKEDVSTGQCQSEMLIGLVEERSLSTEVPIVENHPGIDKDGAVYSELEDKYRLPIASTVEQQDLEFTDSSLSAASNGKEQTDKEVLGMVEDDHSSSKNSISDDHTGLSIDDDSYMTMDSLPGPSLEEKVTKFIQSGDLDPIEDDIFGTLNESGSVSNRFDEPDKLVENHPSAQSSDNIEHSMSRRNADSALNGRMPVSKQVMPSVMVNYPMRDDSPLDKNLDTAHLDKDMDFEAIEREKQVEINHLKFMLHQKEMELFQLKEQIEREKLALSALQTKAETEISKAQSLILEKDAELLAAEESLCGLVEVELRYAGDGEIVEVAGSFNGWHHRIKLDPLLSSAIDPIGSRLWSTMLWLYPGVYEIKFIVDGQWRMDPQRESVTKAGITNNILRVSR